MNDWQPARLVFAHGTGDLDAAQIGKIRNMVLRVRPLGPNVPKVNGELFGCPSGTKMYQVHPDDADHIWPTNRGRIAMACEHEILTD